MNDQFSFSETLLKRTRMHRYRINLELTKPAASLVPESVKGIIREQSDLLVDIAEQMVLREGGQI